MQLQYISLPFLPLASRFMTFWLGHALKSKSMSLGFSIFGFFFRLSFFSFSFSFAVVNDLLLGLLSVKKLLRKRHRDGNFYDGAARCCGREFCSEFFTDWAFWAFLCISRAPFGQSPWSGHHWKDVFLLQKLSIDDANFGQKGWRQKWKKGRNSSRPIIWPALESMG